MYTRSDKVILWLSQFEFVTYGAIEKILEEFDDLGVMFDNIIDYRKTLSSIFKPSEVEELYANLNIHTIDRLLSEYDKQGISIVTILSDRYPDNLKNIEKPPIVLYCKGDISLLKSEALGVVGTRRATRYGKDVGNKLVSQIASTGITIVSGLAEGIDTVAHRTTLDVHGKTIAVLGGGFGNIYPNSNQSLADEIVKDGGLLISEYKPSEPSLTYHFPIRNRIIAGLCDAVLIVEATEKSGSMHTKNFAIEYGKEVFAVPGRIGDIYSVGCNKIIANGQARVVMSAEDILQYFDRSASKTTNENAIQLTYEEQMIYDSLVGHEKHFDELVSELHIEAKVMSTLLMRLEIMRIITKLPGNFYKLSN